jgi:hypothetical protein
VLQSYDLVIEADLSRKVDVRLTLLLHKGAYLESGWSRSQRAFGDFVSQLVRQGLVEELDSVLGLVHLFSFIFF